MIFSALDRLSVAPARRLWWWATALTAASPLFWISGLRPMSDLPGLALALLSLALMLGGRQPRVAGRWRAWWRAWPPACACRPRF